MTNWKTWWRGIALGHPLHVLTVHFPMACFPLAWLFQGLDRFWPGLLTANPHLVLLEVGLLASIPALATGLVELVVLNLNPRQEHLVLRHLSFMGTAVAVFFLGWLLHEFDKIFPGVLFGVNTVGLVILFIGGWFGGELVYGNETVVRPDIQPDVSEENGQDELQPE